MSTVQEEILRATRESARALRIIVVVILTFLLAAGVYFIGGAAIRHHKAEQAKTCLSVVDFQEHPCP